MLSLMVILNKTINYAKWLWLLPIYEGGFVHIVHTDLVKRLHKTLKYIPKVNNICTLSPLETVSNGQDQTSLHLFVQTDQSLVFPRHSLYKP